MLRFGSKLACPSYAWRKNEFMNRNQGTVRAHRHRLGHARYGKTERSPEVPVADSFPQESPRVALVLAPKSLCQLTHSLDSFHLLSICQVLDTLQNLKDTEAF